MAFQGGEPAPVRSNRVLMIGAGALALTLGAVALWGVLSRNDEEPDPTPMISTAASPTVAAGPPLAAALPVPAMATETYAPPDASAVGRAFVQVGAVYRVGGVSELARQGRGCFEALARAPNYQLLDYCLAFDAFSAAVMRRLAGDPDTLPASSWFGQAPTRGLQVAQAVMGPQGDAAARLLDIRRLALEAARVGARRAAANAPPTARPERRAELEPTFRPPPDAPLPPLSAQSAAPPPSISATPRANVQPRRPQAAQAPVERERPAVGPSREVARAAAGQSGARPSFSCRSARTRSERLVCGDPELARLDRELNRAYEDAIASGVGRRTLRREQDSWLAVREAAAADPDAVAEIYEVRIDELRQMQENY